MYIFIPLKTVHFQAVIDMDIGMFICSVRTYYRILASRNENTPRGMQVRHESS